jgi:tRNA-2-methylthio-N6-dimethylallyladenosine synthase
MVEKKLYIKSYGCQMNVYDGQRIEDLLRPHGYSLTDDPNDADLAILNGCHIREKAQQKVHSDLGRLHQIQKNRKSDNKEYVIAVGGCVAQAEGEEVFAHAPYVSIVFGPQSYHHLPEMLAQINTPKDDEKRDGKKKKRRAINTDFPVEEKFDHLPMPHVTSASAFLTVQEGCDKFCHFCCVPYTRGAQYSRTPDDVLKELAHLVERGVVEVTLLGQNVNAYDGEHRDKKIWSLGRLIYEIADRFPKIKQLRYTTSHPNDMHEELMRAHGQVPMLCPFLHLPVQSGSDQILKTMNRKHTVDHYKKIIDQLRNQRSDMVFSSDFIVGYPGESATDHAGSLALIDWAMYGQVYSFKYSKRSGTPAAVMEDQVPLSVQDERLQELQHRARYYQEQTNLSFVGRTMEVLLDRVGRKEGQLLGRSPYMQSVHVEMDAAFLNHVVPVTITHATTNSLTGRVG